MYCKVLFCSLNIVLLFKTSGIKKLLLLFLTCNKTIKIVLGHTQRYILGFILTFVGYNKCI